jgi:hypothetical protein
MPSYESSMRNLAKARAKMRAPRPWRSSDESRIIRRFVFQWLTASGQKPSGRSWARKLGISHTWLQKLVRSFIADSSEMRRLQALKGDPKFTDRLTTLTERLQQFKGQMNIESDSRHKDICLDTDSPNTTFQERTSLERLQTDG